MIIDSQTNKVFLADCLSKKHPKFFEKFVTIFNKCNIPFELLPHTKDIWAVDYMPIQVDTSKFVQFTYNPDYLQSKQLLKTISNVDEICEAINLKTTKSDIVLDAGNVTKTTDKVIVCDKIFSENQTYTRKELLNKLRILFEVDKLFLVPQQPKDFSGHSDGMVRFLDNNTVIVNDYSNEDENFQRAFKIALHNAGLDYIEIPYNPYSFKPSEANGDYINFLQVKNTVIVPVFGIEEDDIAIKKIEEIFKGKNIETIESNDVAKNGGVLNCITWNIKV